MIKEVAIGIIIIVGLWTGSIKVSLRPPPLKREKTSDYISDDEMPRGQSSRGHYLYAGGGGPFTPKKNNRVGIIRSESVDLTDIRTPQVIDIAHAKRCLCVKCSWCAWCCSLCSRK